ncbi:Lacal_2735 family protein [Luteirhabdus pelagi]|uniref:Lacal_2735 family protein n=1 Tax=Luteirhabdus pelagi TaxID=2792783 RepID=UPI0019393F53
MFELFHKKTKFEKLKAKYSQLMRRSFNLAITDKKESDRIHEEAKKVFEDIKAFSELEKSSA